jgi:hypothetical protein
MKESDQSTNNKVMKTLFGVSNDLFALRNQLDNAGLEPVSVLELYNLFIEIVDLVKHIRQTADYQFIEGKKNPQMVEVPGSYQNVGGLLPVRDYREIMVFSENEKIMLEKIQIKLINFKKQFIKSPPLSFKTKEGPVPVSEYSVKINKIRASNQKEKKQQAKKARKRAYWRRKK